MSELPPRGPRDDTAQIPLPDDADVRQYMNRRADSAQAPPGFVDTVMERVGATPVAVPWWQRPVVLIGAVSAAAVVAAVLAVLVLTRDPGSDGVGATASPGDGAAAASGTPLPTFPPAGTPTPTSSPTPPPTEAPTGTPAPTASPTSPAPTPTATPTGPPVVRAAEEQEFDGFVDAVIADDGAGGFVAVGGRDGEKLAWISSDGASWDTHAVPHEPLPFEATSSMGSLARLQGTLYSLGTSAGRADDRAPLGWRTVDAVTWEEIESQSEFYQEAYLIFDLVAGEPGLLAVNHGFAVPSGGTWFWTLDTSWSQTTPGGVDYQDSGITIYDATWGDDRFVAVGNRGRQPEVAGASWTSTDGRSWEASPEAAELERAVLRAVSAAPGGGFVAVGSVSEQAAAWRSDDGLSWTRAELPAGDATFAHAVVPAAGGLAALGAAADGTRIWTSRDGAAWTDAATLEGEVRARDGQRSGNDPVAARDGVLVVFLTLGDDLVTGDEQTVLWRVELE